MGLSLCGFTLSVVVGPTPLHEPLQNEKRARQKKGRRLNRQPLGL
jgi:hypothetical protein